MKTVLMTGAAGDVATHLRRELGGRYSLRLTDRRAIARRSAGESFVRADLARLPELVKATRGVDAVVHLGGVPTEAPWEPILRANLIGAYNLFEACRRAGVRRVVFASTNHTTGFYRRDRIIDDQVYPRSDSRYGVSKVFGEQMGFLYAQKYGLEVFCIRIGNVTSAPADRRRLSNWISPRDLAQLVTIGLEHADLQFEIVYGVSGNDRSFYDNGNATRLGYRPQDNSEVFAAKVLRREAPARDSRVEIYQGGPHVIADQVVPEDKAWRPEARTTVGKGAKRAATTKTKTTKTTKTKTTKSKK